MSTAIRPQAWTAAEADKDTSWTLRLNAAEAAGIHEALLHARAAGKPFTAMTQADFPLPEVSRAALARAIELTQGRWGMCLVKGFPVERWSEADTRLAYWGMSLYMGVGRTQNRASEIINNVRDEGGNRYHWMVDGPAGVPVEWHSELHDVIENRQMAWRSIPGSMVDHSGRVQFEDDGAGGTRVQVDLCYVPVAGAVGHAIAKAFGTDPKSEMDADLMRFKSRVETGNLPHDAGATRH